MGKSNTLTVTLGLKFLKSDQIEAHPSFLEPVNLELKLAVFNFFANFQPHLFLISFFKF